MIDTITESVIEDLKSRSARGTVEHLNISDHSKY